MHRLLKGVFILLVLLPSIGFAQITMPTSRIVFQRGNNNRASVPIQGNCPSSANSIQVKATAINGGSSQDWITIGTTANGVFMGSLSLSGGWYSLQVRALANGNQVAMYSLDKFGVGEVFVIAGQSNILGSPYARNLSASDDRVSTINYRGYPDGNINEGDLPTSFINAANNSPIGPENNMLFWGDLGDKLVARLGVPVLFLGGAYGGTSAANWADAAVNGTYEMDTQGGRILKNAPYRPLGIALSYYIKRTGIRSVIWHQGESDPYTSQGDYVNSITQLINKSRSQTGLNRMSWMICRATYFQGITNPNVINAQNQLADANNNCFPGPATDFMSGSKDWRFDDGHINDDKYPIFEGLFYDLMTTDYFAWSEPSLPGYTPSITTGYIFPHERNGGDHIQVPFMATAPVSGDNQYVVQLLSDNGEVLANLGAGSRAGNNLIDVQLPVWADGRVRVRVNSTSPARNGEVSEFFIAHKTGDRPSASPMVTSSYAPVTLTLGTTVNLSLPANFSDPSNSPLTYSVQNLPAGLSANGLTLTGTPSGNAGSYTITVIATNAQNLSVNASVVINYVNGGTTTPTGPTTSCGYADGQFLLNWYGESIYAHYLNGYLYASYQNGNEGFKPQSWLKATGLIDASKVSCFATTDPHTLAPTAPPTPTVPTTSCGYADGQFLLNWYGESIYAHYVNGYLYASYQNSNEGFKPQSWLKATGLMDASKVSCFATTDPHMLAPTTPTSPSTGTTNPVSGQFEGYVDVRNCSVIAGWVYNGTAPNEPVMLEVLKGGTLITTGEAAQYRSDLVSAGKGNGYHGYAFDVPASLKTGGSIPITVRVQNTGYILNGGTFNLTCPLGSRLAIPSAEVLAGTFRAFPNPTTDYVTISIPSAYQKAKLSFGLVSMDGREEPLDAHSDQVDTYKANISPIKMGLYVLQIYADGLPVSSLKVLKQ